MTLAAPDEAFLDGLRDLLGPKGWRDAGPAELTEPRDRWRGQAALVARPATAEAAAEVVRRCAGARVPVVPYGGGTGLVGGQIRMADPPAVLLSLERMNRVREVLPDDDAMIVEAGVTLAAAHETAEAAGRVFPLSIASEGTARIGGILSTNAGGVQVLKYGNARDLTLGIEAVLPDGSILRGLKTLRKDNTGYDLRHLLIGAEGTLGVITAAALKLYPRPAETATAFVAVPSPEAALKLLHSLRARLGDALSAFELMAAQGFAFLDEHFPDAAAPLAARPDWAVLLEAVGPAGLRGNAEAALAGAMETGLVTDALVAESEAQRARFWRTRETIPEANRKVGSVSSHDISAPMSRIAEFIARGGPAIAAIDPSLRINCFGHLGDGNLHYNVFPAAGRSRADYEGERDRIKRTVHDLAHALGGSHSAEHGIGRLKIDDMARYGDPVRIAAMRAIKRALDPAGIMNPGAVLPEA